MAVDAAPAPSLQVSVSASKSPADVQAVLAACEAWFAAHGVAVDSAPASDVLARRQALVLSYLKSEVCFVCAHH